MLTVNNGEKKNRYKILFTLRFLKNHKKIHIILNIYVRDRKGTHLVEAIQFLSR